MHGLIEIKNGTPSKPTFSQQEMSARLAALRKCMAENDIGAAVFTSIHNINYFADFVYCGFGRPYGLIVTHDAMTTLSANIDGGQPWRRTFGHANLVYTDWQRDNYFRGIRKLVPNGGRVGIEYDHVTLERRGKFAQALPDVEFVDIGEPAMRLRVVKSPEERGLIREGARRAVERAAAGELRPYTDEPAPYAIEVELRQSASDDLRRNLDALPEFELEGDTLVRTLAPDMDQGFRRIAYLGYAGRPGITRY